jgi:hypothetical protein
MNTKVIFAPGVDEAILNYLDFVDVDAIPQTLHFINEAQKKLANTLSMFPMGGAKFQNNTRFYPTAKGYVFIYEYDAEANQVNVLDLYMPGRDWR